MTGLSAPLKRSFTSSPRTELVDRNGCFQDGLGYPLPGRDDWRPMVSGRSGISHKLPGAITCSCLSSYPDVHQNQNEHDRIHPVGQCHGTNLHQQERGTRSPSLSQLAKMLCMERSICSEADHILRKENIVADR